MNKESRDRVKLLFNSGININLQQREIQKVKAKGKVREKLLGKLLER